MEELRKCKCGTVTTNEEDLKLFRKNKLSKYGRANECVECAKEKSLSFLNENREKITNKRREKHKTEEWKEYKKTKEYKDKKKCIQLKHMYGITLEDYNKMLKKQNYTCKICPTKYTEKKKLVVDHCHTEGHVRGLLCGKCNIGLGQFDDNIEKMLEAINYLKGEL